MKILSIEQIRQLDAYTIQNEPVKSIDLMERSATNCFNWLIKYVDKGQKIIIYCGLGNNAGDGLVIARLLIQKGYNVEVCIIRYSDKYSDDFKINYKRLSYISKNKIYNIKENDKFPEINKNDIVIDTIFGSGLTRPVKGFISDVIEHINDSKAKVISLDIPSGLFGDINSNDLCKSIIKADYTLTIQFPKYSLLFPENNKYVGSWHVIPIGLHPKFIESVEVKNYLLESDDIKKFYKKRNKYSHKGNFGHSLLISGSYGKMGAAVLSSRACLRAGAGLLTTHIPKCGYEIMQVAVPEAMISIDSVHKIITDNLDFSVYKAVAVGPGIGKDKLTQNSLKTLIQNFSSPIVFDADAINIIADNKEWLSFIPSGSIFTPHPKEFERLAGKSDNNFHRNEIQRKFAKKYNLYIVLKGANTSIACPDGTCYFNTTGNPGMATAGSGDVLTGIILGLLSQSYNPKEACLLGVYIHGLAGDIAAKNNGFESLIANDIINNLGKAFINITSSEF
jgi:NAD(P)H-hydrate epimerase